MWLFMLPRLVVTAVAGLVAIITAWGMISPMAAYHFLGTYVIAAVTFAYAALAVTRLRPGRRHRPARKGEQ